jgi:hypothetical protein
VVTPARSGNPVADDRAKALLDGTLGKTIIAAPDGRRCLLPAVLRALAENSLGQFTFVADPGQGLERRHPTDELARDRRLKSAPADVVAFWNKY